MAILITHPMNLGTQTFRMNRSNKDGTPKPGWWEAADCRKYNCPDYLLGWTTAVDTNTDLGRKQFHYLRTHSHLYSFKEEFVGQGLVNFRFEPGQKCFRSELHIVPVERDPIFSNLVAGGEKKVMDYDEFHTTFNETTFRIAQNKREV